ncbi:flagellar motor protein MotA [Massilia sp. WF1]|uniref:flagellar motor stator protein MotA n=1 Tax=unclassified Massilia TaxID=2609279 RepID=UPI00064B10AE|nr:MULTISPECIES: flagellar motor stator protein MotA [unclassified Massilia]ALK97810.1 flagellar motor stator protein MotA [Massilia sp. WG5]KLU35844.1 flagellar motor protein MotA [Massilia sp. WF1]
MLIVVGFVVVLMAVFGGFVLQDGHLAALFQPYELLMIFGGALGAFVIGNDRKAISLTWHSIPTLFHGSRYTRALYMQLMALMFDVLTKVRREGLMSLEDDIDAPWESPIFTRYRLVAADEHLLDFITDYLRLLVSGTINAYQLENLMDNEIETYQEDSDIPVQAINKLADGMPAFGIVAAVMGVVHTMGAIGRPPAELGSLIAAALVGTFLGILLSYGLVAPLASLLHRRHQEVVKALQCVKVTLLASMNGYAPTIAVEFGRKVISATERPTFAELEGHVRQLKSR